MDARIKSAHDQGRAGFSLSEPRSSPEADVAFMRAAFGLARRGLGRVWPNPAVGCVIVRDGAVIARGRNRTVTDHDPTAHAEMVALRAASVALGAERLTQCDIYVTLEPCTMCAGALSFARIRRLYYGAVDPKGGAVDSGVRFFDQPTCHHRPDVYGGIAEQDAAALLRAFFAGRRP
jgi:tRNA(adenine34) deaminase